MGLFDFFIRRKAKRAKRRRAKGSYITIRQQITGIKGQIDSINNCLQKHRKDIDENTNLIREHSKKIQTLEQLLASQPTNQLIQQTNLPERPASTTRQVQSNANINNKFDIDSFSPQEKKILSVFFNHQDMDLSYRDIASILGKAPNTIKNQIHQICLKADIFDKAIGNEQRNRFRLKDGIKIEKYINVNQTN
jgi:DNA-binding CsgD family transcriptional regulator